MERLSSILNRKYKCSVDLEGKRYIGLTLDISMPGYVERALQQQHQMPGRHKDRTQLLECTCVWCTATMCHHNNSPLLPDVDAKNVQTVLGTFLYYACAKDLTMIMAMISNIATEQANATERSMKAIVKLLNCKASNSNARNQYYASGMYL